VFWRPVLALARDRDDPKFLDELQARPLPQACTICKKTHFLSAMLQKAKLNVD
jgi:hypothetical protein